jgi:hypothetical protein
MSVVVLWGCGCHSDWALLQWALGGMRERTVRYRRLFVAARRLMNWHSHLLQRNAFNSLRYVLDVTLVL